MNKTKEQLQDRITELETFITESEISKKSYNEEKVMLINELQDINKPVISSNTLDDIYQVVEDHMGSLDDIDPADCEFDFGIDYDGRITVEGMQILGNDPYNAEALYYKLKTLFKVKEEEEDEDSI